MSHDLVERMKSELSPQLQGYLAKMLGEQPAATAKAVDAALPALLSGVATAGRTQSGLAALSRLVNDPVNDGTLLNQLPALYQGTMTASPVYRLGAQLLHQSFGAKLGTVNQSIASLAGIKPAAAATLTATLAPHVLAQFGRLQRASGDASAASLAKLLGQQASAIEAAAPKSVAVAAAEPAKKAAAVATKAGPATPGSQPAAPASVMGASDGHAATAPLASRARPGSGAWVIFPLGLVMGTGLIGLGSIISDQMQGLPGATETTVVSAPAPAPASAPVTPAPAAPAPFKAAAAPAPATPAAAPATQPKAIEPERKPGPPGTTSFFGQGPSAPDKPVVINPDYKPAAPAVAIVVPESIPRPSPPGTTSFFGTGPSAPDKPVVVNPDYSPAAPAVAIVVPESPPRPSPPGTTSFFGTGPGAPDKPVVVNPDYKPAAPAVAAAAPMPPAPAPATPPVPVPALAPSGTTSFYGRSPSQPDKPVAFNPDYKPAAKSAAASAPAATLDLAACRAAVGTAIKPVQFETASAKVSRDSLATLDRIGAAFKSCAAARLKVEGHTDDRGSSEYNLKLSEARARSVRSYLAGLGINRATVSAEGFGFAKPLVPNSSPENMARNRRIEFIVEPR